ncbi:MAG: hypothetical protein GTO40_17385 [Deltaproteobacteria bacterium]|nr:hypothetical protein [Deltaproteobacteria bacterium]
MSNSEYSVEQGIEIPELKIGGRRPKYPFPNMKVGDSFTVPIAEFAAARSASHRWGERHDKQFTTRMENEHTGRIWRTK